MSLSLDPRGPNLHVGDDVTIGDGVEFGANVVVHDGCSIGAGTLVGDNAVLGKRPALARSSTAQARLAARPHGGGGLHASRPAPWCSQARRSTPTTCWSATSPSCASA